MVLNRDSGTLYGKKRIVPEVDALADGTASAHARLSRQSLTPNPSFVGGEDSDHEA